MTRKAIWTVAFLTVTAAALGLELFAAFDDSPDTQPWTSYLISLPWWILVPLALIFSAWLPIHLWVSKKRRTSGGVAVVEQIPVPPSKEADARNRSWRTLWQQLGIDVAIAVVLTVGPQLIGQNTAWTKDFLITMAVLAAKTAIATVVAYFARKVVPPKFDPDREVPPAVRVPDPAPPQIPGIPPSAWTRSDGA